MIPVIGNKYLTKATILDRRFCYVEILFRMAKRAKAFTLLPFYNLVINSNDMFVLLLPYMDQSTGISSASSFPSESK